TYRGEHIDHLDTLTTTPFREKDPKLFSSVIMEPIQGEGGYLVPPLWYVQELKHLCEEHGILFIADEVQTGMGRTGKMFCMEHYGIEPDIITLAKGIANGLPLGATIAKADIMDSWGPGAHASTFGGNPVSDRAALAVIDELTRGGVLENCQVMGNHLTARLLSLLQRHRTIGNVRGMGLMIGVEFVGDRSTPQPVPAFRDAVVRRCFESGLLLLGCGPSTIRVIPPLNVTKEEIDAGIAILDRVLTEVEEQFNIRTPQWGIMQSEP
ncbi:aminotransferase class III-fold pyridoxal phosphate-dependent enzyme, partial [Candidatus Peregrinibacteria bacterium]|nr:aminotransferase class III-fold pyridoxal phosphate-dependent enzyme [Candidatus Peregrinibacteria bacterium]